MTDALGLLSEVALHAQAQPALRARPRTFGGVLDVTVTATLTFLTMFVTAR